MESKPQTPIRLEPMDFFPFRGQYGGSSVGAAFFVAVRAIIPLVFYTLLVPPDSSLSISSMIPWALPSQPPPAGNSSIPFVPSVLLHALEKNLGLQPYPAIIFLGATIPTLSFILYNALWRRERFPMTGQGGSIQVTTQVNLTDIFHAVLYVYFAGRNPTWSPEIFKWTPFVFMIGIVIHVWADHSKYLFRKDSRNKGKVYTGGAWSIVRHPNFLGFTIWRVAFATAAGGWAFGVFLLAMFVHLFQATSVPVLEDYMARSYGRQWEVVTQKVPWKLIPGLW